MLWDLDGGSSVQIQDKERNKGEKKTEKQINKEAQKMFVENVSGGTREKLT